MSLFLKTITTSYCRGKIKGKTQQIRPQSKEFEIEENFQSTHTEREKKKLDEANNSWKPTSGKTAFKEYGGVENESEFLF
jgi:hypothetical protein